MKERCAALVAELQTIIAADTNGECLPLSEGVVLGPNGRVCAVFLVPLGSTQSVHREVQILESMASDRPLS